MTTIKITELSDIGANLTTSTVVPVVNMAGTPVTQKTNIGNIANLILEGAGVDYPEASVALLAQTVSNAAQPNITSVGTLTNITVSGNASINGNITSNGTAYLGNISTTGEASITTLVVGSTADLGSVNNVIIEGGTDGQVLTTDGDGNLSWTTVSSGNSSYGDSNVVSLMAAFGSNTITTTGNISGGNLVTGGQVVATGNVSSGTGLSTGGFLSVDGNTDLHNTIITGNLSTTGTATLGNVTTGGTITSTGTATLGNITTGGFVSATGNVTGNNINTGGLVSATGNANVGNVNTTGLFASTISSTGTATLGNVTTGGTITSTGTATLGNVTTGGFVSATGNVTAGSITTTGNISANGVISATGNVTGLNIVTGGNVQATGDIAGGNLYAILGEMKSNVANIVSLLVANVITASGNVTGGNILTVGNISATGNITANNLGNIATINLTGSNSNVLYGNGVFAAVTVGNLSQISNGNSNVTLTDTNGNVYINTNGGTQKQWIFDTAGNLRTPGNVDIYGAINFPQQVSSLNWSTYNIELSQYGRITTNVDFFANANTIGALYLKGDGSNISNIAVANIVGLGNIATANLTGSNSNVLYGNGVFAAVAGGGGNTGNVTFDDNIVIGTGDEYGFSGLYLAVGPDSIANGTVQYLRVRGGDYPTHIHLDTGNNQYYDQYFGADSRYVKLEANGNVVINADDYLGNSATWTLTTDGNLILAGGNSVIQSIANSSLDTLNPNVSTMVLTPDPGYGSQALVLDPTLPGHIHLRAPGANIDEPTANLFLGGEDTAFEITEGANNQAVIHSNGKAWTFGNDGNISSDTLTFTTTFANVKTVEYQTAGVWDLYVEDSITGSNTASSRLNVSFKDNLIDQPQVYIENTKESDGIALRWTFDENGNLNFPRDVVGNSDPYLNIFGGSTPTIQSTDVSLAGPANLAIQSNYLNLSGFTGEKITFFPDDGLIATDYDMVLTTNVGGGNTYTWTLDATGNLNLPGNLVIAGNANVFGTDSALIQPTDDKPLIAISSGANGAIATTWVEDIGNIGTSNIAAVYANPIPGSGIVRIAVGQNGNAGPNLWDFNSNGTTTFPGDLIGNGASPAPSINGFNSISALTFTNGTSNVTVTANATSWTFGTNGNLTLPEGGIVTNNIPPVTFDILYQYDDLEWDGVTVTFTNASSTYMLGVLALMQAGDPITLVGPGGPISTTVAIPYTGGSAGYFTVTEANSPIQITQFTLPNRLPSVTGIKLTTNAKNYLFTEAGVTQSPVLTVDTLPSGQYAVAGFRAFVSDANLAPVGNFGEIVGNSGANTVCVWCDGTDWRIG